MKKRTVSLVLFFFAILLYSTRTIEGNVFPSWKQFGNSVQSKFHELKNAGIDDRRQNEDGVIGNQHVIDRELIRHLIAVAGNRLISATISYFTMRFLIDRIKTIDFKSILDDETKVKNVSTRFPEFIPYLKNTTLNDYEIDLLTSSTTLPTAIKTDWNELGGLVKVKTALTQISSLLKISESSYRIPSVGSLPLRIKPVKSILLHGPPGNGKTALVQGMAKRLQWPIISITPSSLLRKYIGETSLLTRAIFSLAKKLSPCIVFIDEMDSLFRYRSDSDHHIERNLMTEFMQLWDESVSQPVTPSPSPSIKSKSSSVSALSTRFNQMHQILVIGATNRPQDLDPAIQRRFQRNLLIPHPDTAERLLIFKKLLAKVEKEPSFSFDEVLSRTEGYCANDLLNVCQAAMLIPIIERKQFLQAERRRRRSSAEQQPVKPTAPNEETTAVVAAGDGNSSDDDEDSQEEQQGPKIFGISLPLQWRRSISGRETVRSIPSTRKNETQQPAASQPAYSIPPLRPLRVEDLLEAIAATPPSTSLSQSYGAGGFGRTGFASSQPPPTSPPNPFDSDGFSSQPGDPFDDSYDD